ncbi:PAS domain-containing protein [Methyloceanibacter caenitepidi]|uniref:histidine kinase n=1 Tax=Methyloceanibacter caenitepidi TaxID=1384459 RepID=A0A0A8K1D7_9HYPH|nr:PAS domain-containing protein [Methyloceanibacter caenitepidi]BAQ16735.1 sigma factor-like phosphatase with CBS pair domains [Methyloceanibacter caenitepidi]
MTSKDTAARAAAALEPLLIPGADPAEVTAAIEKALIETADGGNADASARTARLLSASPAVLYSFKARDDFAPTFVSDNIEGLFGYAPADYLGNPGFWRERVHPDDLERLDADLETLFETGELTVEYRFRHKDGTYRWVNDEQHLIYDAQGAPSEVVGSWSDISARKSAEAREDATQARLSTLLEAAPAVIYSFKARDDYAPTFVSENIKRLLGYCPEKYMEHADFWRSHVHPDDLADVEAEGALIFDKGRQATEYRFRKRNGKYIWVSDEQYLLRDEHGEPVEIVGSWTNISARKTAEEAENAARARFDLMLHSAPAVVYSFSATGSFAPTFVSGNIKRVLGYEPDDYLKQADFWRSHVHPDDLPAIEAGQSELFDVGRRVSEYRFRKADGTYCWVSDEQTLIKDRNGVPLEVIGSWSEVTERKTAEQAALQEREQRLTDAIETISEGFSLYDSEDRLVLGNQKYGELFDAGDGPPAPGTAFETILREAVAHGLIADAKGREEGWLRQRLDEHRYPGEPILQRRSDGRWLQISERRTETGGTVAVYSDLTDIKESERRAAAANHLILQSLHYASRIQSAVLPARRELEAIAADHFLIWEPRDIVGGDFFWFQPVEDGHAIMVGDCTGHGVPGAFMTLIAWGLLDRTVRDAPGGPSAVLSGLHQGVQSLLGQDEQQGETDDGLEAGVCFVDLSKRQITFAGARFSLWRSNREGVIEIKGDREGLGYRRYRPDTRFTNTTFAYGSGDAFYLTTDGLIEQIGGPRGRAFGKQRFRDLLHELRDAPMNEQEEKLRDAFEKFQGDQRRRDDLTVLGFIPHA